MKERIVCEAINNAFGFGPSYKELILLYEDGTWERIFRYNLYRMSDNGKKVKIASYFRGKTRTEVIAIMEELYYNDMIYGDFLDES